MLHFQPYKRVLIQSLHYTNNEVIKLCSCEKKPTRKLLGFRQYLKIHENILIILLKIQLGLWMCHLKKENHALTSCFYLLRSCTEAFQQVVFMLILFHTLPQAIFTFFSASDKQEKQPHNSPAFFLKHLILYRSVLILVLTFSLSFWRYFFFIQVSILDGLYITIQHWLI